MRYRLPSPLYSWAWSGRFLALAEQQETTAAGLILPRQNVDDRDAVVHYAQLLDTGVERNWLWLFPDKIQASALRLVPDYDAGAEATMIEQTLPRPAPGERPPCFVLEVPVDWLYASIPGDIHEVWVGFDYRRFAQDRTLRGSADYVFPAEEFRAIAAR